MTRVRAKDKARPYARLKEEHARPQLEWVIQDTAGKGWKPARRGIGVKQRRRLDRGSFEVCLGDNALTQMRTFLG